MINWFKKEEIINRLNIEFDTLYNIFNYLKESEDSSVKLFIKDQFEGIIKAKLLIFPENFGFVEDFNELKEKGFDNFYDLLNQKFEDSKINPIDINEANANQSQYDFLEISFYTKPESDYDKKIYKKIPYFFYFIFVILDNTEVENSYRAFMTKSINYSELGNFFHSRFIEDLNEPEKDDYKYLEILERNLVALSEFLTIEVSEKLKIKYPESLLLGEATEQDFNKLMQLVNYNKEEINFEAEAKQLYIDYNSNWEELNYDVDFPTYSYFPNRFEILFESNTWFTDWKFDPEDAEGFISDILNQEWDFEYPENTFSADLFPYIQKALSKNDLELMNIDCEGDSYCFFIVDKKDVSEILLLSYKLKIGIEKIE